jgi:hypothetical protein
MPPKAPTSLWQRIIAAVRRDPQKAGILTLLVAILVVLQVRLWMSNKDEVANATTNVLSPHSASGSAINSNQTNNGVTSSTVGNSASGKPQDSATALRSWMDAPEVPIGRNLFVADLDRFPADSGHAASANQGNPGFWDELAKSMGVRADVRKERQILVENLTQQASQLRLQSTLMGASPKAVINGDLVGEGDNVASGTGESRVVFRVVRIEARRILVEREGIKLEIQMK